SEPAASDRVTPVEERPRSGRVSKPASRVPLRRATAAQLAALALAQAAPDAEALIVLECVLEALSAHRASRADALRVARRAALLGKEGLGIGLRAERVTLPRERVVVLVDGGRGGAQPRHAEPNGVDEPVLGDRGTIVVPHVSALPSRHRPSRSC